MNNKLLTESFSDLSTPLLADALIRLQLPLSIAPPGIRSVSAGSRLSGRVLPARHYGSVDVFLEAMGHARPGDVLVIDNGGRRDEGCIGDLTALEAQASGLSGIVVWGTHRDAAAARHGQAAARRGGAARRSLTAPEPFRSSADGIRWPLVAQRTIRPSADGSSWLVVANELVMTHASDYSHSHRGLSLVDSVAHYLWNCFNSFGAALKLR